MLSAMAVESDLFIYLVIYYLLTYLFIYNPEEHYGYYIPTNTGKANFTKSGEGRGLPQPASFS